MGLLRILAGVVVVLLAGAVSAQTGGLSRPRAAVGLQAGHQDFRISCGTVAFPCDTSSTLSLYESGTAPRSVAMQVGSLGRGSVPQGLKISLVGKAGLLPEVGVYGRLGTTTGRAAPLALAGETGTSYGVGLSWDFSRSASAVLGWDSYDMRGAIGESRDVRATSLGLQWRY